MYQFQILAYEEEIKETENNIPLLNKVTEIWIIAKNAAEALKEAQEVYVARHYHIRRINKMLNIVPGGQQIPPITPGNNIIPT